MNYGIPLFLLILLVKVHSTVWICGSSRNLDYILYFYQFLNKYFFSWGFSLFLAYFRQYAEDQMETAQFRLMDALLHLLAFSVQVLPPFKLYLFLILD